MTDTITQMLKPETFANGQNPLGATQAIMDMVALGSEPDAVEEPEFKVVTGDPIGGEDEAEESPKVEEEEEPAVDAEEADEGDPDEEVEGADEGEEESDDPYAWPESVATVKAKRGDREFDVPEDAVLQVKVDGKNVEVSVADLRRNYSAKIPWEQKYSELKRKEKDIEHREVRTQQEVQKHRSRMAELVQKGKADPFGMIVETFLESGASPDEAVPLVRSFFSMIKATSKTMSQLSDADLDARVLSRALEVKDKALQKRASEFESGQKAQAEQAQLASYIAHRQQELGITDAEMDEAIEVAKGSDAKEFWEMPLQKRADTLMSYVMSYLKPKAQVTAAIDKVAPQLADNGKFHQAIMEIATKEKLTPAEIEKTIGMYLRGLAKSSKAPAKNGAPKRETPSEPSDEPKARPKKASKKAEPDAEKTIDPVSMDEVLERFGIR